MRRFLVHKYRRIEFLLLSRRTYWYIRQRIKLVNFQITLTRFKARNSREDTVAQLSILGSLFRISIRPIIPALAGVLIILVLNAVIDLPVVRQYVPSWLVNLFGSISSENYATYDGLLTSVITVIGIFLTLYFTNLATVIGSLYSELPGRIRNLLLEEKVGNVSLQYLVSLTVFSILLLLAAVVLSIRP